MSVYQKGPIEGIKYCIRCCTPETQEGQEFDEMGICTACISSEDKMHLDWVEREKQLKNWKKEWKLNLIKQINPNLETITI